MTESRPPEKRIGIIGGSFDPPHLGHLIIAQDAVERLGLCEVVFIPAAVPPHKTHLRLARSGHRLNMLDLAVQNDDRFVVSDIEIVRGGVSYTVDTVAALKTIHPAADLFLIVGSDTLLELHTWNRMDELLRMCTLVTLLRPGTDSREVLEQKIEVSEEHRAKLMKHVIAAHRIGISSTEIRRRIAEGRSIRYFVSPEVEAYIIENSLYRG